MKKVERRKVCQFRCLSLKGNKNSQQVKPQDCRSQVAGKVVPPLAQGTTVQLSSEGTRNSCWTPQAQKKFSPFIWHRNKFFLFQVKEGKKKKKRPQKSAQGCQVFSSPNASKQCFDSKVPWAQTPPYHSVHDPLILSALTANANTFSSLLHSCSSAFCQHHFACILPHTQRDFCFVWEYLGKIKIPEQNRGVKGLLPISQLRSISLGPKKKKFLGQNSHVCRPHANDSRERC